LFDQSSQLKELIGCCLARQLMGGIAEQNGIGVIDLQRGVEIDAET
jgi:hypothetical protein